MATRYITLCSPTISPELTAGFLHLGDFSKATAEWVILKTHTQLQTCAFCRDIIGTNQLHGACLVSTRAETAPLALDGSLFAPPETRTQLHGGEVLICSLFLFIRNTCK